MTNTNVFKLLFVYYFVGLSGNVFLSFLGLLKFLTSFNAFPQLSCIYHFVTLVPSQTTEV
jgi:hypothetical protein